MTCLTPAAFAASAMFFAWAFSFSPEKCSQKFVTANTPYAPANAFFRLSTSSRSAWTTSAPLAASRLRLVLGRVARDRAGGEAAIRIVQNRLDQTAALRAGRTDYRNDFLVSHIFCFVLVVGRCKRPSRAVRPSPRTPFEVLRLAHDLFADDLRAVGKRLQLHLRDHARQRLHAAVGAQRHALRRHGLEHLPDALGDLLRRFDRVGADIEHADLNVLVLRQVLQELDAGHVAVRVVEHELIDAGGVEEVRQHRLVALGEAGAQDVVAPRVAEAEVPADLRVHAVAALGDDVPDPLVVVSCCW